MLELISFPWEASALQEYSTLTEVEQSVAALGCDGLELVWGGETLPDTLPCAGRLGYHLTFYPDWLDFWRGDESRLLQKFGSRRTYTEFYGGESGQRLLDLYEQDLRRAAAAGSRYVVFHVSDISVEEGFTYHWLHTDEEVIDASAQILNLLWQRGPWPFPVLVENQWWPGFTFTEPDLTRRLLEQIQWPDKGIMLDTGHLMNTCPDLRSQQEGADYILRCLRRHGDLAGAVRGVHLHQSLSGEYVKRHTGFLPPELPADYLQRFAVSYRHILQIDRHQSWTDPAAARLLQEIRPEFLTHELSAENRYQRETAVRRQKEILNKGGYHLGTET